MDRLSSDTDRIAPDRDEFDDADGRRDELHVQASADVESGRAGDPATRDRDATARARRAATAVHRLETHEAREAAATLRSRSADERDAVADTRDKAAHLRDIRDLAVERCIAASDTPVADQVEQLRARAARARTRAAADRARAAAERGAAARERAMHDAELRAAHLDGLTGAFSREMGRLVLTYEIARARRADGRLVIAFVDVDGLERINRRDGQGGGDRVLHALVAAIRSNLRSFDPIVRYAGDEFVCGLGGADLDEARRRFELIGWAIENQVGVGISVGLAVLAPDDSLDELIANASAAMTAVKLGCGG